MSNEIKKINIAIDGPAGSGKTTVGKLLAQKTGYRFLDSGLLYRHFAFFYSNEKDSQESEVLPKAEIKVFLTADLESGAERRYKQYSKIKTKEKIKKALRARDKNDKEETVEKFYRFFIERKTNIKEC